MTDASGTLEALLSATWPPARTATAGGFTIRFSDGGGQRATSATALGPATAAGIAQAEAAMEARGQHPLFRVREGEEALDAQLAARGYERRDETVALAGPLAGLAAEDLPRGTAFAIWPPLAIMEELWDRGGIGPDRRGVMDRATGPKTGILARIGDRPSGVAFAAAHEDAVAIHAVWVHEAARRQNAAHRMMICAARWAQDIGMTRMAAFCLQHNQAAVNLYTSFGFSHVGRYHYRAK